MPDTTLDKTNQDFEKTVRTSFFADWKFRHGTRNSIATADISTFEIRIDLYPHGVMGSISVPAIGGGVTVWRSRNDQGVSLDEVLNGVKAFLGKVSIDIKNTLPINAKTIVFHDRTPSKKNNRSFVKKGTKIISVPSKEYTKWEADAIRDDLYGIAPVPWKKVAAEMVIYAPDKRAADLSNKWESIADCLVKAGIIPDDNWFVLAPVTLVLGGVDKGNPRAVVTLREVCDA